MASTKIANLSNLNRLVATAAFGAEPPLSERRGSGAWKFIPGKLNGTTFAGHWEPAKFASDPGASYALRQKMRESNHKYESCDVANPEGVLVEVVRGGLQGNARAEHTNECTAVALATLRALGVEFELQEGWDK